MSLRILWVSNAGWAGTGYGNQTRHITAWLRDQGHDIGVLAFWGLEGGRITYDGIPYYPRHLDVYGNDAIAYYARVQRADMIFTLIDAWVMDPNIRKAGYWCCIAPIDHDVAPAPVIERLKAAHLAVAYSCYGERKMVEAGVPNVAYVPHGIDCENYRPLPEASVLRRRYYAEGEEDRFWIGMVAANKGWPARKGFPEAFEAFAEFHRRHADARLYIHATFDERFRGPNLNELRQRPYGIPDGAIFFGEPMRLMDGYTDEQMNDLYNTFDVFLNPAYGEGFGIPTVEAQAAGVPVIVGDNTAQTELCGAGWLVPTRMTEPTLIGANWYRPDPAGILSALEEAYAMKRDRPSDWAALRAKARRFARGYDWPLVFERYWTPLMARIDRETGGAVVAELRAAR